VKKQVRINISFHCSKAADEFVGQNFHYIITVCDNAKENCPFSPATRIHQSFENPPAQVVGDNESRLANQLCFTKNLCAEDSPVKQNSNNRLSLL